MSTFGESHGKALGVIVDGCPPGISLSEEDFTEAMKRRAPGQLPYSSSRVEPDNVEILSGVFEGRTTGTPIGMIIHNKDAHSRDYEPLRNVFRPGHADITYFIKYGIRDHRGGGRASSRETVARVAAGVIAQKILDPLGVKVKAYTLALGNVFVKDWDRDFALKNPLSCPDRSAFESMMASLKEASNKGDSLGGIVLLEGENIPPGLGEPVFDKLEADLGKAILSVGATKGVEFGEGFGAATLLGSQNNDPITPEGFRSNNSGGILGGISNGDRLVIKVAIKPIPSISLKQDTIDQTGSPQSIILAGRFDVCAIPRILPVLEAMVLIVLADHFLRLQGLYPRYMPQNLPLKELLLGIGAQWGGVGKV